jgi:hypothetical protein
MDCVKTTGSDRCQLVDADHSLLYGLWMPITTKQLLNPGALQYSIAMITAVPQYSRFGQITNELR